MEGEERLQRFYPDCFPILVTKGGGGSPPLALKYSLINAIDTERM